MVDRLLGVSANVRAALLCVAMVWPFALSFKADPDLWWQVHTGLRILESRSVPSVDDLSFTAAGSTWTNHEWLAQVMFAAVFDMFSGPGLMVLRAGLLAGFAAAFGALVYDRSKSLLFVAASAVSVLPLLVPFLILRVHTFTLLFVLAALPLAAAAAGRAGPRRLVALAALGALMVVWVNTHGGFLIGAVLVSVVAASHVACPGGRRAFSDVRWPAVTVAAVWVSTLANPHGWGMYRYLYGELGAEHSIITEWAPAPAPFKVLLAALAGAAVWAWFRGRVVAAEPLALAVMFAGSAAATVRHVRFLPFALVFAALLLAHLVPAAVSAAAVRSGGVKDRGPWSARHRRPFRSAVAFAAVAAAAALVVPSVAAPGRLAEGLRPEATDAPAGAVEFLAASRFGPNVVSHLEWGGFLIWELSATHKVAVDGRNLTVYDDVWVDAYLRGMRDGRLAEVVDVSDADVWLVKTGSPQAVSLEASRSWVAAYVDRQATVFVPAGAVDAPARPVSSSSAAPLFD